jgi:16S rRNA processing protein RimM
VVKTQGRHGEVATEIHSDVPDRFQKGMKLWALAENGSRRELKVEEFWPHKQWLVFKFGGIESISDGEALKGCELQVPVEQRAQLESGWSYVSELAGCTVYDAGREIGKVKDVRFGAGEAPLLVVKSGDIEYEIPFAEAYLKRVALHEKRIEMALPQGILEVNAPLSAEEKQEQRATRNRASHEN